MEKVVVGFSGGLDTTYCVKYLTLEKGLEVHSVIVNTGGFSEEELKKDWEELLTIWSEIENKMKPIQGLTIKVKGNAQKKDYKKSLIVDLTGVNQEKAAALAQFLGGSVGPLPEGEKQPNTDILIIATQ